jgi:hypothetical protein
MGKDFLQKAPLLSKKAGLIPQIKKLLPIAKSYTNTIGTDIQTFFKY